MIHLPCWRQVNWELQDAEIAKQIGRTKQGVQQKRRDLQIPNPVNFRRKILKRKRDQFVKEKESEFEEFGITLKDIKKVCGFSADGRFPIPQKRAIWERVLIKRANWDLPSRLLDKIWNKSLNYCEVIRYKYKLQKPKFDLRKGDYNNPKLLELVQKEKKKVAEFYSYRGKLLEQLSQFRK